MVRLSGESWELRAADGRSLTLPADGRPVFIGRESGSDLQLPYDEVSRRHASFRLAGGEVQIRDEGSTNGTTFFGQPLQAGRWYPLPAGAEIAVAGYKLDLQRDVGSPPSSVAPAAAIASATGPSKASISALQDAWARLKALATGAALGGPAGVGVALTLEHLHDLAASDHLESRAEYARSMQSATAEMARTSGVVDLPRGVPTILISDIHARRDFLTRVMDMEVGGEKVFDLLKQGRLNVVCLGDGMHAEGRAEQRWQTALDDHFAGRRSPAMEQEMVEGLGTMKMVMELKTAFPENFHFLRGNHEDVVGKRFMKYAAPVGESILVREDMERRFGADFLRQYAEFENQMPLVARGQGFVASHAAPGAPLTRAEIEGRDRRAFDALTWTDNPSWSPDDPQPLANLRHALDVVGADRGSRWIVGHRPVDQGLYRSQFGGQLVQINAPSDYVVAFVGADGSFDPSRSVIAV